MSYNQPLQSQNPPTRFQSYLPEEDDDMYVDYDPRNPPPPRNRITTEHLTNMPHPQMPNFPGQTIQTTDFYIESQKLKQDWLNGPPNVAVPETQDSRYNISGHATFQPPQNPTPLQVYADRKGISEPQGVPASAANGRDASGVDREGQLDKSLSIANTLLQLQLPSLTSGTLFDVAKTLVGFRSAAMVIKTCPGAINELGGPTNAQEPLEVACKSVLLALKRNEAAQATVPSLTVPDSQPSNTSQSTSGVPDNATQQIIRPASSAMQTVPQQAPQLGQIVYPNSLQQAHQPGQMSYSNLPQQAAQSGQMTLPNPPPQSSQPTPLNTNVQAGYQQVVTNPHVQQGQHRMPAVPQTFSASYPQTMSHPNGQPTSYQSAFGDQHTNNGYVTIATRSLPAQPTAASQNGQQTAYGVFQSMATNNPRPGQPQPNTEHDELLAHMIQNAERGVTSTPDPLGDMEDKINSISTQFQTMGFKVPARRKSKQSSTSSAIDLMLCVDIPKIVPNVFAGKQYQKGDRDGHIIEFRNSTVDDPSERVKQFNGGKFGYFISFGPPIAAPPPITSSRESTPGDIYLHVNRAITQISVWQLEKISSGSTGPRWHNVSYHYVRNMGMVPHPELQDMVLHCKPGLKPNYITVGTQENYKKSFTNTQTSVTNAMESMAREVEALQQTAASARSNSTTTSFA